MNGRKDQGYNVTLFAGDGEQCSNMSIQEKRALERLCQDNNEDNAQLQVNEQDSAKDMSVKITQNSWSL